MAKPAGDLPISCQRDQIVEIVIAMGAKPQPSGFDDDAWLSNGAGSCSVHNTSIGPKYGYRHAGSAHASFNARSKIARSNRFINGIT
jgi:hypothetical protein